MRRIWLYTSSLCSWLQRGDQTSQFKQFFHAKQGAPGSDHVEWVLADDARPAGGQRPQSAIRVVKPNPVLMPVLGVKDQFEFLQMKGMVRMSYLETSASSVTQGRSCLRTPTPCAKASSPPLNANCWRARTSPRVNRRGARSSTSWRRGTTRCAFTAGSAIARRSFTNSCMQHKNRPHPHASCPPPAGAVVVTGDPPTGRGQLAVPLQTEVIYPLKIQLRNRPPKRVTPNPLRGRYGIRARQMGETRLGSRVVGACNRWRYSLDQGCPED